MKFLISCPRSLLLEQLISSNQPTLLSAAGVMLSLESSRPRNIVHSALDLFVNLVLLITLLLVRMREHVITANSSKRTPRSMNYSNVLTSGVVKTSLSSTLTFAKLSL
jgi:hypothetical protein